MRGCRAREVDAQVVGRAGRVDVAVLALQRHAVAAVHDQRVEDARAGLQPQALGQRRRRLLVAREVHLGVVALAARLDLLVQVADRQRRGHAVQRRGEGAHALHALDQALGLQLAHRAVHRHPADAELRHQLGLGRHQRAGRPAPPRQAVLQELLDAGVGRGVGASRWKPCDDPTCANLSRQVESPTGSTPEPRHDRPVRPPPARRSPHPGARAARQRSSPARNWLIEAAYRMLQNNLDPEVAENPDALVVYGGIGKAARNWDCFEAILAALKRAEGRRDAAVQSGKPVGVFRTHADAPRVLIANSNLVPKWATWEHFDELDRKGLMMYGQMTAGSLDLHRQPGHRAGHLRDLRRSGPTALRRQTWRAAGSSPPASAAWAARSRWRPRLPARRR